MIASKNALRALLLALGAAGIIVLVARLGPREIAAQIARAGPGILWLLAAYAAGTAVCSLPWGLLMPKRARPGARSVVASRFAASGANAILPLFGFGGEPARLLWLRPPDRALGLGAIVVDRLLYTAASAIFVLAGAIAVIKTAPLGNSYVIGGTFGAIALLLAACAGAWIVARHRIAGRIERVVRRLRKRSLPERANGFGDDIDEAIEDIFRSRGRAVAGSLGIHFVGRVLLGAEIYAGFFVLGVPLSPHEALIFASMPVMLAVVGSMVPSQLGLQEGALALVAVALEIAPATAVAVVLMQRVRQVATVALAWGLMAWKRPARAA